MLCLGILNIGAIYALMNPTAGSYFLLFSEDTIMRFLHFLFSVFTLVVLIPQKTTKVNWLHRRLYNVGGLGSYLVIKRNIFRLTLLTVSLFLLSVYHIG